MANTDYRSVDQYLAAQPPGARKLLQRVRRAIRDAIPDAEEVISYQIPAYKLNGRLVAFFSGWTEHFSLYPVPRGVEGLEPYRHGRGTLRFPLDEPPPLKLITRIARGLAADAAARAAKKTPAKKTPAKKTPAKKTPAKRKASRRRDASKW